MSTAVLFLVAACTKENKNPVQISVQQQSAGLSKESTAAMADPAANPLNNVDSVGLVHNKALDFALGQSRLSGGRDREEIIRQFAVFFHLRYGKDILSHLQQMAAFNDRNIPEPSGAAKLTEKFNPVMKPYLEGIISQLKAVNAASDFTVASRQIVTLETKAAADGSLTAIEKVKIGMVASVARHSLWYWLQKTDDEGSAEMKRRKGIFHRIWRAVNIAIADTEGAISGIYYLESIPEIIEDASLNSAMAAIAS